MLESSELLSRIQFAANISFHILFPSITIGLAWFLLFFKWRFHRTGDKKWLDSYFFWTKIFALSFALGVVSGVTMSFQFGTNWPGFMNTVGNIAGPLLAYEVLTAFFLEASFLGIMLFGYRLVSPWVHNLATFMVAFGTTLSAFWILALNSWMQTPTGAIQVDGVWLVESWLQVVFNPSFPYRFTHMFIASLLTAAFLMAGISAFSYWVGQRGTNIMAALKTGVYAAALLIPIQIFVGDLHGLNTLKHQPAKIAAMEGLWQTTKGAELVLFAIPNEKEKRNDFALTVPKLGSVILTHSLDGEVKGLNEFENNHPPVKPVFYGFRLMVGIGLLMLAVAWIGAIYLWRYDRKIPKQKSRTLHPYLVYSLMAMTFSGWVAVLAGWYVTEIGRQPWLVHGLLKTTDAVAQHPAGTVLSTLIGYLALYVFLTLSYVGTIFYMARSQKISTPLGTELKTYVKGIREQA